MKQAGGLEWVGVDLHVHTPASKDYQGPRGDAGFLDLLGKANDFSTPRSRRERPQHNLACVAFTDHNSVDGFTRYRELSEEAAKLRDSIRLRDPNNPLIPKLEKDLEVLNSVRLLMGCEIKANPGVHLLLIFHESLDAEEVVRFLEEAYGLEYAKFDGDPSPTTSWPLQQVLDDITTRFKERAMVVAPHVDSGGGLYEALKEFQQLRMLAFKHPALAALSFNKPETRDRVSQLLTQPDYRRTEPVALIQSSDYHGQQGLTLGQPRSELHLPSGKATFANIREAFRAGGRVKCSCDFTQEEYDRLTKGHTVAKFQSDAGTLAFRETDYEKLASAVGSMLNSEDGIVELQGEPPANETREVYLKALSETFAFALKDRIDPPWEPDTAAELRFSPSRVRVLFRVFRKQRLHTVGGTVYVIKNGNPQRASSVEIESVVSRNIDGRFGGRFEDTLDEVSAKSSLLSRVPRGIPIVLEVERNLLYVDPRSFKAEHPPNLGSDDREKRGLIREFRRKAQEDAPLGLPNPEGNLTLPFSSAPIPPRFPDHYLRFTTQRVQAPAEFLEKVAPLKIEKTALVVFLGGGVSMVEPGHLVSQVPLMLLEPPPSFAGTAYALAAWLKSSFMVWYCAVHLASPNLFRHIQIPTDRLPLPRGTGDSELLNRLDSLARNIVLDENKMMKEVNKQKARGTCGDDYLDKEIDHHNARSNGVCLTMDEEIYKFLGVNQRDQAYIARTLRDIPLSDFGFLAKAEKEDKQTKELDD